MTSPSEPTLLAPWGWGLAASLSAKQLVPDNREQEGNAEGDHVWPYWALRGHFTGGNKWDSNSNSTLVAATDRKPSLLFYTRDRGKKKKGKTLAVVRPELPPELLQSLELCSFTQKGKDLHRDKPGKKKVHRQVFVLMNKLKGCKTLAVSEDSKRKSQTMVSLGRSYIASTFVRLLSSCSNYHLKE